MTLRNLQNAILPLLASMVVIHCSSSTTTASQTTSTSSSSSSEASSSHSSQSSSSAASATCESKPVDIGGPCPEAGLACCSATQGLGLCGVPKGTKQPICLFTANDTCTSDEQCSTGSCKDNVCAVAPTGGSCFVDDDCGAGILFDCINGSCVHITPDGGLEGGSDASPADAATADGG